MERDLLMFNAKVSEGLKAKDHGEKERHLRLKSWSYLYPRTGIVDSSPYPFLCIMLQETLTHCSGSPSHRDPRVRDLIATHFEDPAFFLREGRGVMSQSKTMDALLCAACAARLVFVKKRIISGTSIDVYCCSRFHFDQADRLNIDHEVPRSAIIGLMVCMDALCASKETRQAFAREARSPP